MIFNEIVFQDFVSPVIEETELKVKECKTACLALRMVNY